MNISIKNKVRPGRGFTLIEALIAMVLLGFAITALVVANRSASTANGAGLEMSTAEFLTEQIKERTVAMTFSTLVSTYTTTVTTYSPPHDSQGNALTAYQGYSQRVTGKYLQSTDFTKTSATPTVFYRITVEIRLNNETISSASWLRANY